MKTLQTELNKYRNFLSDVRHLYSPNNNEEKVMQQNQSNVTSRSTGGVNANKRYKRTTQELDADIEKVDKLVATGKYNQIEALKELNLQSSVYHLRKRQQREEPAKSNKPRKFAHRNRKKNVNPETYELRKQKLLETIETKTVVPKEDNTLKNVREELSVLKAKYDKLKEYVVEHVILN